MHASNLARTLGSRTPNAGFCWIGPRGDRKARSWAKDERRKAKLDERREFLADLAELARDHVDEPLIEFEPANPDDEYAWRFPEWDDECADDCVACDIDRQLAAGRNNGGS